VKTLESKETKAQRKDGNAQFSLCCCTSTMPDDDCKIDIRHFLCLIALVIPIRFDINRNKDTILHSKQSQEIST